MGAVSNDLGAALHGLKTNKGKKAERSDPSARTGCPGGACRLADQPADDSPQRSPLSLDQIQADPPHIEAMNAVTMLALPVTSAAVFAYKGSDFGFGAWWLILAFAVTVPGSVANHLFFVYRGRSSPLLMKLDRTSLSLGAALGSWSVSQSGPFFGIAVAIWALVNAAMYVGPARVRDGYWLMTLGPGFLLVYSTIGLAAFWPHGFNPYFLPEAGVLAAGVVCMITRPIGAWSHPLFHVCLAVVAGIASASAHDLDAALRRIPSAQR